MCPSISQRETITLAHGSGSRLSRGLLKELFVPIFDNPLHGELNDSSVIDIKGIRLAFSTDSFVIDPIFFPGGDIGQLAVYGTVNDLAMSGAIPYYLSTGMIIEEGFPIDDLRRITISMKQAGDNSNINIIAGDTKVVPRGKVDKIFINTTGIGLITKDIHITASNARAGDKIIINGPIGEHGIAILAIRGGFELGETLKSDLSPLSSLVEEILKGDIEIHTMRDPTRGGIAASLNEIAESSNVGIEINENDIPIREEVKGVCEILGIDPLYVANEGRFLAFVRPDHADQALDIMKGNIYGKEARIIGGVVNEHRGKVILKTCIGGKRIVDLPAGEQLPRIC